MFSTRRIAAGLVGILLAVPLMASADTTTLTPAMVSAQFNSIGAQLTVILTQFAAAQARGTTYTQSAEFHTQVNQWLQQVTALGSQLVTLIAQSGALANTQGTSNPTVATVQPGPGYSTGSLSAVPVGGVTSNLVSFTVTANPTANCGPTTFNLSFGDGQSQPLTFPGSCSSQAQPASHTYASSGTFTAALTSGTFRTTLVIGSSIGANEGTPTITTAAGSANYSVVATVVNHPGSHCLGSTYTLDFGDNSTQTISFPASCTVVTQTYSHTYPQAQSYTIKVADPITNVGVAAQFSAAVVAAAGNGNPLQMLALETASGATSITDQSIYHRTLSNVGVTTDSGFHMNFNGTSFITTGSSGDFNFGTNPFTVELKFKASSFPVSGGQAALMVQSDSSGSDSSLGGAGLELYGTQIAFVGRIGGVTYHPFYNNTLMSTSTLQANTWYHVALVRSGNTLTLYVNGARASSMSVSGSANISTGDLGIGRYGSLSNNYYRGLMNSVHIYNGTARWTAPFDVSTLSDSSRYGITTPTDSEAFRGTGADNSVH